MKSVKTFEVYLITNKITGKRYVGKCFGPSRLRWSNHVSKANTGSPYAISRAIRKHGRAAFQIETLERCFSNEDACRIEIEYIAKLNTFTPYGYNLTKGGEGAVGHIIRPETRRKMSMVRKGKKLSEEQIRNSAKGRTGLKRTPEFCERMSKLLREREPFTIEHRRNLSKARLGKKRPTEFRIKMSNIAKRRYARTIRDSRQSGLAL